MNTILEKHDSDEISVYYLPSIPSGFTLGFSASIFNLYKFPLPKILLLNKFWQNHRGISIFFDNRLTALLFFGLKKADFFSRNQMLLLY